MTFNELENGINVLFFVAAWCFLIGAFLVLFDIWVDCALSEKIKEIIANFRRKQ